jgi:hypothetical protein
VWGTPSGGVHKEWGKRHFLLVEDIQNSKIFIHILLPFQTFPHTFHTHKTTMSFSSLLSVPLCSPGTILASVTCTSSGCQSAAKSTSSSCSPCPAKNYCACPIGSKQPPRCSFCSKTNKCYNTTSGFGAQPQVFACPRGCVWRHIFPFPLLISPLFIVPLTLLSS